MDIITEENLRTMQISCNTLTFSVKPGTYVTPGAKEYLNDRGIALVFEENNSGGKFGSGVMSGNLSSMKNGFVEHESGKHLDKKPEFMTHLYDNVLVPKNDPRILFRGKLDSLEALIMETQVLAAEEGYKSIADELEEIMRFVQHILACEVKDEPVGEYTLLSMNEEKLRYVSHNVKTEIGFQHSVPNYAMGKICVKLNSLRTFVREAELSAAVAFIHGEEVERPDILEALNRLSSCVYIVFCRHAAGNYPKV